MTHRRRWVHKKPGDKRSDIPVSSPPPSHGSAEERQRRIVKRLVDLVKAEMFHR